MIDKKSAQLLDQLLLVSSPSNLAPDRLLSELKNRAERAGDAPDVNGMIEYLAHLSRIGVLALAPPTMPDSIQIRNSTGGHSYLNIPKIIVTEHGRRILAQKEISPHNRSRYLEQMCARIRSPDAIILAYIEEAVSALDAGLYRSCAVMTGCACERLIHLLAAGIVKSKHVPWSDRLGKTGKKAPASVSAIFDQVREALLDLAESRKLPGDLADALDRRLSAIFDHVRIQRNEAGHPTGEDVAAGDAEASLLVFPGFYLYSDKLIKELEIIGG